MGFVEYLALLTYLRALKPNIQCYERDLTHMANPPLSDIDLIAWEAL